MRSAIIPLLLALTLSCARRESAYDELTPQPPPAQPTAPPENLRAQSGGYVRPPKSERVIVFVNGIFGDAVGTWKSPSAWWPQLVADDPDFGGVDVYVHSFDSPKIQSAQKIDELASRLRDYLSNDRVLSDHKEVVFLCHSMGGLVTRAFLLKERVSPDKVPMIYFFGTPTAGANVAGIGANLSANPQLADMRPLDGGGYVRFLREQWLSTSSDSTLDYPSRIKSFCAYETRDTWRFRVVEELSATYLCNCETRAVQGDHLSMVKPDGPRAEPHVYFKAAYLRRFGPAAPQIARVLTMHRMVINPRNIPVSFSDFERVTLKQAKATNTISVGCGQETRGEIDVNVPLSEAESLLEVVPSVQNKVNITAASAALVRHKGGTATLTYRLRGPARPCRTGGSADVVASFITRAPGRIKDQFEQPRIEPRRPRFLPFPRRETGQK